jgi:hypothetical protein
VQGTKPSLKVADSQTARTSSKDTTLGSKKITTTSSRVSSKDKKDKTAAVMSKVDQAQIQFKKTS